MSVASSKRRNSQLLYEKKVEMAPSRRSSGVPRKCLRFQLPHSDRVRSILEAYINRENLKEYEQLVRSIRDDELQEDDVLSLLEEVSQCIPLLNQDVRLFVEALLVFKWAHRSDIFVKNYQSFLVNLLSAHNYHAKYVIDQLVSSFLPDGDKQEWPNGEPADEDCKTFANIHSLINILLKVIPMSRELLQNSLVACYPYFKRPTHVHEVYLHNILWILDYQPELRLDVFYLIFTRLIILDVNAPREDILQQEQLEEETVFLMDDCKSVRSSTDPERLKHSIAHTLDVCLDKLFNHIVVECYDIESGMLHWDKSKKLYQNLVDVFDKVILPTYNIHHVQFVMFFMCSLKPVLTEGFINYLWKKVCAPNMPSVLRQTAVAYISSLLARGNFITVSKLRSTMEQLAKWIHSYITNQDGLECLNSDVRVHAVFYSVCQALFYIVAFRHRDLVNTRKSIVFLESLNLAKIVTCRLNPLRVCQPAVVQNFAAITRTYQLAYCYSIIEHNARNVMPVIYLDEKGSITTSCAVLDSFFPFDPYLLKRSSKKITPIYLEYKEADEDMDIVRDIEEEMDEDDFLNTSDGCSRLSENRFSYGRSPGFKFKH